MLSSVYYTVYSELRIRSSEVEIAEVNLSFKIIRSIICNGSSISALWPCWSPQIETLNFYAPGDVGQYRGFGDVLSVWQ